MGNMNKKRLILSLAYLSVPTVLVLFVWSPTMWIYDLQNLYYTAHVIIHVILIIEVILFFIFKPCNFIILLSGIAMPILITFVLAFFPNIPMIDGGVIGMSGMLLVTIMYFYKYALPYMTISIITFAVTKIIKNKKLKR